MSSTMTMAWCFSDEATVYTENLLDRLGNLEDSAVVPVPRGDFPGPLRPDGKIQADILRRRLSGKATSPFPRHDFGMKWNENAGFFAFIANLKKRSQPEVRFAD